MQGDETQSESVVVLKPESAAKTIILYIHGGGWVFPPRKEHWRFLARLADKTGSTIHAALYPLAPKHTCSDVQQFLLPVYRSLVEDRTRPLVVMGDSAGGNIALALLRNAFQNGIAMPSGLVLISPCVDATVDNPDALMMAKTDPMLALGGLRAAASWYAGDLPVSDPTISPLLGSLAHLPRTQIFIGTNDLLLPDVRLFRDKARNEAIDINYQEVDGMMHVWPIVPYLPEARVAMKQIAAFISKLERSS